MTTAGGAAGAKPTRGRYINHRRHTGVFLTRLGTQKCLRYCSLDELDKTPLEETVGAAVMV